MLILDLQNLVDGIVLVTRGEGIKKGSSILRNKNQRKVITGPLKMKGGPGKDRGLREAGVWKGNIPPK